MRILMEIARGAFLSGLLLGALCGPEEASAFDGSRAWRDLERIVQFGPRPSGSLQLDRARRHIVGELRKAGIKTRVQSFIAETSLGPVSMANVIGEIPGRGSDVILIGGHYDTKYYPGFRFVGANDGGSSAALLVELARSFAEQSGDYTIWVVFFDGEEERSPDSNRAASYGSKFMTAQMARSGDLERLRAAIIVDMVGDRDLGIVRDSGSTGWITDILWKTAGRLGHGAHFLAESVPMEDDHVPFLRAGIPSVLLIDYDYGNVSEAKRYWHSSDDTLDKLSSNSLEIVGRVILDALPEVASQLRQMNPGR